MTAVRVLAAAAVVLTAACGGSAPASFGPEKVALPVTDGLSGDARKPAAPARLVPPPSAVAKEAPFPAVSRWTISNGLRVDVLTATTLPLVHVRLLVWTGSSSGAEPGVADLTALLLKDGGTRTLSSAELLRRIETMGATLGVSVDADRTALSLAVPKEQLAEALSVLAQVVREPRFDEGELAKTKAREIDAAEDAARSSGSWTASWLVFRELFGEAHPYGTRALLPSMIRRVDGAKIRDFHRRSYLPRTTMIVLAGDVDPKSGRALVERAFGSWTGGPAPERKLPAPKPLARKVLVAHRPKSVQSDVYVAMVAPERRADEWPSLRVANQVLGGGVASRLFSDVRERRSLAYRTSAQILELALGPQPLVLYAGTQTEKTAEAVTGLLENAARMTSAPPTAAETETARRYLSDVFAVRMETLGGLADMVAAQETLGLDDVIPSVGAPARSYWDVYRERLRATTADDAARAARTLYAPDTALVVVAGDADVVAAPLATFGEVVVVDPEKEFKVLRTLPKVQR